MATNPITDALNIFAGQIASIKAAAAEVKTAVAGQEPTATTAGVTTGQSAAAGAKTMKIAGYTVEPVYLFLGSLALFLFVAAVFRRKG